MRQSNISKDQIKKQYSHILQNLNYRQTYQKDLKQAWQKGQKQVGSSSDNASSNSNNTSNINISQQQEYQQQILDLINKLHVAQEENIEKQYIIEKQQNNISQLEKQLQIYKDKSKQLIVQETKYEMKELYNQIDKLKLENSKLEEKFDKLMTKTSSNTSNNIIKNSHNNKYISSLTNNQNYTTNKINNFNSPTMNQLSSPQLQSSIAVKNNQFPFYNQLQSAQFSSNQEQQFPQFAQSLQNNFFNPKNNNCKQPLQVENQQQQQQSVQPFQMPSLQEEEEEQQKQHKKQHSLIKQQPQNISISNNPSFLLFNQSNNNINIGGGEGDKNLASLINSSFSTQNENSSPEPSSPQKKSNKDNLNYENNSNNIINNDFQYFYDKKESYKNIILQQQQLAEQQKENNLINLNPTLQQQQLNINQSLSPRTKYTGFQKQNQNINNNLGSQNSGRKQHQKSQLGILKERLNNTINVNNINTISSIPANPVTYNLQPVNDDIVIKNKNYTTKNSQYNFHGFNNTFKTSYNSPQNNNIQQQNINNFCSPRNFQKNGNNLKENQNTQLLQASNTNNNCKVILNNANFVSKDAQPSKQQNPTKKFKNNINKNNKIRSKTPIFGGNENNNFSNCNNKLNELLNNKIMNKSMNTLKSPRFDELNNNKL